MSPLDVQQTEVKNYFIGYSTGAIFISLCISSILLLLANEFGFFDWFHGLAVALAAQHVVLGFGLVAFVNTGRMKEYDRLTPFLIPHASAYGFAAGVVSVTLSALIWNTAWNRSDWIALGLPLNAAVFPGAVYHFLLTRHIQRLNKSWETMRFNAPGVER